MAVFIFPGQGAQKTGMAKDFYDSYPAAKKIFDIADMTLGFFLSKVVFQGTEEELKRTSITQIAILTVETAIFEVINERGSAPDVCAGHSLGEYSALIAAGSLSFENALKLVQKRAQFMEETAIKVPSGMLAVIGLEKEIVEEIIKKVLPLGVLEVANINSPGQIVVSGELKVFEEFSNLAKQSGAKMCVPLAVSGGFHSSLMNEASERLKEELRKTEIEEPRTKFLSNVTGGFEKDPENIKKLLAEQVNHPVQWVKIMQGILAQNPDKILEIGPGKVLAGLWKRFDKTKQVVNIETKEDLLKI